MNKKLVIAIGVVLILVLAGAGALFMSRKTNNVETNSDEKSSETIQKKSLKEMLGLSSNQECNFSDGTTGNEGVVYVGSGKLRGDFSTKINDKKTESHLIADGTTIYLWSEGQAQGMQVAQSSIENLGLNASDVVDVNKEIEYSCLPWAGAENVFLPPAEVTFTDYSKIIPSNLPSGFNPQCSACANLTGDSKIQCEAALKCN